jgi:hypothetical protein
VARRIAVSLSLSLSFAALSAAASTASADAGSIGVMVDAGVPDGVNGSLVFRPFRPLNIHAGVGTNLISYGVRAGASLYLLPTGISPTLSGEVGRYFPGDANEAANRLGVTTDSDNPVLRDVGYDYANLHLGLDFGRETFSFYIHAGFSAVRGKLRHLDELVAEDADESLTFEVKQGATANLIAPSARIGILFFF